MKYQPSSIRNRFLLPVLFILIPLLIVFIFGLGTLLNSSLHKILYDHVDSRRAVLLDRMDELAQRALSIAAGMAAVEGIEGFYLDDDEDRARQELRQAAMGHFNKYREQLGIEAPRIHYHKKTPQGPKSFLRMWRKPGQKDGGDMLAFRKVLAHAHTQGEPVTGLEVGRGGIVVRGIAPLRIDGRVTGSVEMYYRFSDLYELLSDSEELYAFLSPDVASVVDTDMARIQDAETFSFTSGDFVYVASSTGKRSPLITPDIIDHLKSNDGTVTIDGSSLVLIPLKDAIGTGIGYLVYTLDVSAQLARVRIILLFTVGMLLLFAFMVILVNYIMGTRMGGAIEHITLRLRDISEGDGDLTVSLPVESRDEIGRLAEHFNTFVEKIRVMIADVKRIAYGLATSTDEVSATTLSLSDNAQQQATLSDDLKTTMDNNVKSVEQVAFDTDVQSSSFEALNSRMMDLSNSVEEVGRETASAMEMAGQVTEKIVAGGRSLSELSNIMKEIVGSSVEMNNITSLINDISEQINLLSLNASIEAARAGEHGRGFAVVAEEISKLADSTAVSIKNIVSLIEKNDTRISRGNSSVDNVTRVNKTIIDDIERINGVIMRLGEFMDQQMQHRDSANRESATMKQLSDSIASSIASHRASTQEIYVTSTNISEIGQENATAAEELAATTEEIAGMAEKLHTMVEFFKVGEE